MTAAGSSEGQARFESGELEDRLTAYRAALLGPLQEWLFGANSLALLRSALTSGMLQAAREPMSPEAIAAAIGADPSRVEHMCLALYARGVFGSAEGLYGLAPGFAVLLSEDAPQTLDVVLQRQSVLERILAGSLQQTTGYTDLGPDDLLAMAWGVSRTPGSPLVLAMAEQVETGLPENVRAAFRSRRRHLELGCGVGGDLINTVVGNPVLTAVGVEREAVLADEARRQAERLGVADRVEFRTMDARDVRDEAAFDSVAWSQFFFPIDTRAATLQVARRALRSGGYLTVPVLPDPPPTLEGLREPAGHPYTTLRMLYGGWGVPIHSAADLQQEVEAAGFEVVGIFNAMPARMLVGRS